MTEEQGNPPKTNPMLQTPPQQRIPVQGIPRQVSSGASPYQYIASPEQYEKGFRDGLINLALAKTLDKANFGADDVIHFVDRVVSGIMAKRREMDSK